MRTETLLIIGASGHAKVVIDALRCELGSDFALHLADDDVSLTGKCLMGMPIMTPVVQALACCGQFHVAIGNNAIRRRIAHDCIQAGMAYKTVVHPRAILAKSAVVKSGCFIAAGAILAAESTISGGCIINHGAVVDHDCFLDQYCHVAPNATLGGGVQLGRHVMIGAGANILPGVSIADDCFVGAGAVVLHDLPAGGIYVGMPAKRILKTSGCSNPTA